MPTDLHLSQRQARRLFLHRQGLSRRHSFGRGMKAVAKAIDQLGYVQIDTISVVNRAHHHVLQTRIEGYSPAMLDKLLADDRRIFEYWSHAAAYLPMSQYRYCLPMMQGFARRPHDAIMVREVLARIRSEGALRARDFEHTRTEPGTGWWDWKPAKRALEYLFLSGELMITRREGFAKVYDLRDRVLPAGIDTRTPEPDEWTRGTLLTMLDAQGVASLADLSYARNTVRQFAGDSFKPEYAAALQQLLEIGEVIAVTVDDEACVTRPELLEQVPARVSRDTVSFLSPFDNLVINRNRTRRLFGLDYQLECYVPEAKRQFGYFCLPILWGDELVGRMDSKADRRHGELQVRLLQLEPRHERSPQLIKALARGLEEFAADNHCTHIRIGDTLPRELRKALAGS